DNTSRPGTAPWPSAAFPYPASRWQRRRRPRLPGAPCAHAKDQNTNSGLCRICSVVRVMTSFQWPLRMSPTKFLSMEIWSTSRDMCPETEPDGQGSPRHDAEGAAGLARRPVEGVLAGEVGETGALVVELSEQLTGLAF